MGAPLSRPPVLLGASGVEFVFFCTVGASGITFVFFSILGASGVEFVLVLLLVLLVLLRSRCQCRCLCRCRRRHISYYATYLRLRWECHIQSFLENLHNVAKFLSTSDAIWLVSDQFEVSTYAGGAPVRTVSSKITHCGTSNVLVIY
jgi:hypothetical protein